MAQDANTKKSADIVRAAVDPSIDMFSAAVVFSPAVYRSSPG